MERHWNHVAGIGLLFCLLLPRAGAAETAPTAAMFNGTAIVEETGGSSLPERASLARRRWEKAGEGAVFFTAWAFPASGRIDSCAPAA